jgi:hypothetical protein
MASSVVKRMLTGMILSGSWVCFEDAHKLSQSMLSILGDYLSTVRQAYQCLLMNKNSQYKVRGQTKDASKVRGPWLTKIRCALGFETLRSP